MRRYMPVLQIAIVSACDGTASELAERINQRGQFAHVFSDGKSLSAFAQLHTLDVIIVDRREPGFAMALNALRAHVRGASSYAMFCGFGQHNGIVPVGVDYSFCSALLDEGLDSMFTWLAGELAPAGDDWSRSPHTTH